MPFLPLYFRQLGVTDVGEIAIWSGLSLGVTPAMTALLAPFWGRLGRSVRAQDHGRAVARELRASIMAAMAFVTGRGRCSRCARFRDCLPATARWR